MIHKACMPVYMNSGKIVADGRDGTGRVGKSKVLQEVLADLKSCTEKSQCLVYLLSCCFTISNPGEPQSMIFGVQVKLVSIKTV